MEMILAQVIGILTTLVVLFIVFSKDIKKILIGETTANLVLALNFLLLDGISGAGINIIATLHSLISYYFQHKNKKFPVALMLLFILLYLAWGIVTYKTITDILPMAAAVFFALAIMQAKPSNYRILKTFNAIVWIVYDILVMAYTTIITHSIGLVISIIAIVTIDLKLRKNKTSE